MTTETMTETGSTRWAAIKGVAAALWGTAAIRLVLDAASPANAWMFGTFFMTPLALLFVGRRGPLTRMTWKRMAGAAFLLGPYCFSVANLVAYSSALLFGWDHGRFDPDGAGPPYGSAPPFGGDFIFVGLPVLAGAIVGGAWSVFWATLLIWLPGRSKRAAE